MHKSALHDRETRGLNRVNFRAREGFEGRSRALQGRLERGEAGAQAGRSLTGPPGGRQRGLRRPAPHRPGQPAAGALTSAGPCPCSTGPRSCCRRPRSPPRPPPAPPWARSGSQPAPGLGPPARNTPPGSAARGAGPALLQPTAALSRPPAPQSGEFAPPRRGLPFLLRHPGRSPGSCRKASSFRRERLVARVLPAAPRRRSYSLMSAGPEVLPRPAPAAPRPAVPTPPSLVCAAGPAVFTPGCPPAWPWALGAFPRPACPGEPAARRSWRSSGRPPRGARGAPGSAVTRRLPPAGPAARERPARPRGRTLGSRRLS